MPVRIVVNSGGATCGGDNRRFVLEEVAKMRQPSNGHRWLLASLCWFSLSAFLHFLNLQFALYYLVNNLLWHIFGPPESVYSFRNLFLPRLIVVTIFSIPPAILGLFVCEGKIVWKRLILAWICWSGIFFAIYNLFFSIHPRPTFAIHELVLNVFRGDGTSLAEYYLTFCISFTVAAGPSALLGIYFYSFLVKRLDN